MKSIDSDKSPKVSSSTDGKAADENLEEAKEHLGNALKSGAAAAATLGAGLVAKISEALEDAVENSEKKSFHVCLHENVYMLISGKPRLINKK